ncbi:MAG: uroporphyrinogen-III synthase [Rhodospirillaceae bacterium]|nr:uroporphyrinogen-III synthase [Rhodospirillaceae bacterium]MBT5567247.1 uroporphyrinogen-III synthase [Rhodospirillaceae bacterium]MBT6960276.1 uroporphyrinogen-III synthase [Rhodospirillaceae bacterium]
MIINTRPVQYDFEMYRAFDSWGHDVVACPVLTSRASPWTDVALDNIDALIFTSQIALDVIARNPVSRNLPVFAVGPATASAARNANFSTVVDGGGTAEKLLRVIDAASFRTGLYASAHHVSRDLALARPTRIRRQVVYEMEAAESLPESVIDAFHSDEEIIIPFYSPRSFHIFESLLTKHNLGDRLTRATAVAIHARVLNDRTLNWGRTQIAAAPDGTGMVDAMQKAA